MKDHSVSAATQLKGGSKLLRVLLSVILVIGLMPSLSFASAGTAYASEDEVAQAADDIKAAEAELVADDSEAAQAPDAALEAVAGDLEISTPAELLAFADNVSAGTTYEGYTVKLTADIDLSSVTFSGIGAKDKRFAGTFDGQGHKITGLAINTTAVVAGFFAATTKTAVVKNFTLAGSVTSTGVDPVSGDTEEAVRAAGVYGVGAVVGVNRGEISHVISSVNVTANSTKNVGGIAGFSLGSVLSLGGYQNYIIEDEAGNNGYVYACVSTGDVTAVEVLGGIVGRNGGTVDSCLAFGTVDGTNASDKNGVGGIVGRNGCNNVHKETCYISNCAFYGTVGRSGQKWTGGIAGFNTGSYLNTAGVPYSEITNCYMVGTLVAGAGYNNMIAGNQEGIGKNNYALSSSANKGTSEAEIGIVKEASWFTTNDAAIALSDGTRWVFAESTDPVYSVLAAEGRSGYPVPIALTSNSATVKDVSWSGEDTVKLSYTEGEYFDMGDLALLCNYSDGTAVKQALTCSKTEALTTADDGTTVTVSCGEYKKEFTISVEGNELTAIALYSSYSNYTPTVTTYSPGETLDLTGLKLKLSFKNGTTETVTFTSELPEGWTTNIGAPITADDNGKVLALSYTYKDKTLTYDTSSVSGKAVTISVIEAPAKDGDVYLIDSAQDFAWFAAQVNQRHLAVNAKLTADIALGGDGYVSAGTSSTYPYKGTFDGEGHTVTIAGTSTTNGGNCMFYYVGAGAVIKNINFTGTINSTAMYNAPIGSLTAGTVQNITSNLEITGGNYVAGLIGSMVSGTVSDCVITGGSVTGSSTYTGGFIGQIKGGTITNCGNNATVKNTGTSGSAGGFIGTVYSPTSNITITNCYNTGDVTAAGSASTTGGRGGGFIGTARSASAAAMTVTNCYNTGNVTANNCVGGFCGYAAGYSSAKPLKFVNCYNAGTVTNKSGSVTGYTGSFVGFAATGTSTKYVTCTNCYGSSDACASIYGSSSTATTFTKPAGKTAAELKDAAMLTTLGTSFKADGDDEDYQSINGGYLVLSWQELPEVFAPVKIGSDKYASLAAAVEAAQSGDTIEVLADLEGDGIVISKDLTIDFGGFTYTVTGNLVGSAGTETIAFQLLSGNITLKNGTIKSGENCTGKNGTYTGRAKMMVQNYANLTMDGMTIDGTTMNPANNYVVSNNCGTVTIKDSTITANAGAFAFDSCKYASYEAPTVTVSGSSVINGKVEATGGAITFENGVVVNGQVRAGENKADGASGSTVTIENGATVNNPDGYAVLVFGDNTANVAGKVNGIIGTNGNAYNADVKINVLEGAEVTMVSDVAIYMPSGTLTISGGTITGATAVYFKSTNLAISGGKLVGNGEKAEYVYNANGCNATGDALVIDSCNYPNGIQSVAISGGTFESANGSAVATYTAEGGQLVTGFISGGSFNTALKLGYCAAGLAPYVSAQGTYSVAAAPTKGDLNANGRINIVDAQVALDLGNGIYGASFESFPFPEAWYSETVKAAGDVNADGAVDALDARAIQYRVHTGSFAE